jgi:NAD(P)-dependent dehydrogenase (short-subunit alcohol dehydrogenase family)
MRLKDKIAPITGGAAGIGCATTKRFIEEGARVVICDVNQKAGDDAVRDLGTKTDFYRVDIANAYLFLASDEAGFISGEVLRVDGGIVIGT